jgi:Domain of unknown function (DUF4389)
MDSSPLAPMYPATIEIDYPEKLSRWLIFVKIFLAVPHFFILAGYALLLWITSLGTIFIILFTGNLPAGLWDFIFGFDRWLFRLNCYLYLMTDKYPPFTNQPVEDYPARFDCPRPDRLSNALPLVKWILAIPHFIIVIVLSYVAVVVAIIVWFAILFTGRYPRWAFSYMTGYFRWWARLTVYAGTFISYNPYVGGLLRDEYPPFSMEASVPVSLRDVSSPVGMPVATGVTTPHPSQPLMDNLHAERLNDPDEVSLRRLADLRSRGLITEDEYQGKRKAIIDRL